MSNKSTETNVTKGAADARGKCKCGFRLDMRAVPTYLCEGSPGNSSNAADSEAKRSADNQSSAASSSPRAPYGGGEASIDDILAHFKRASHLSLLATAARHNVVPMYVVRSEFAAYLRARHDWTPEDEMALTALHADSAGRAA